MNICKYSLIYRFIKKENIDTIIFTTSPDLKTGGIASKIAHVTNIVYLRGLAIPIKNSIINRILFNNILTHIIANSFETKKSIVKNLRRSISIDNKVRVIYHGIDLELFDRNFNNGDFQIAKEEIVIGNAGRLNAQKGQTDLIKIAYRLKERGIKFKMLIAGTGELKPEIEKLIDEHQLHQEVILLGFVEDMAGFMRSIDIFVLTSPREGFGYVLVEAMAASKPVVAYNYTSPEIVIDNQTGFLVDYPDLDMFSRKIELLIMDKNKRIEFGKNGRMRVENHFQLKDKMTELENCLLNKSNPEESI
ncbi:MAG: glycosyltransferase [Bacteroidia bacterium]|nr:glycosyltransferase [Bacteroidia bacterium]